jgi:hypothetical protein
MTPEEQAAHDLLLLGLAGNRPDDPVDQVDIGTNFRPPTEPRVEGRTFTFDVTQL